MFWDKIGCKICHKFHLGAPRFSRSKILGCAVDKLCSLAGGGGGLQGNFPSHFCSERAWTTVWPIPMSNRLCRP